MQWLEISIAAPAGGVDELTQTLTAAGFSELVIEDQQTFEEFLEENRACWDYIDEQLRQRLQGLSQVKLYLDAGDLQSLSRLQALAAGLGLTMTTSLLPPTDWEESWKDSYPPLPMGDKLMMVPRWVENPRLEGRLPIILEPGLTFGTGSHPTTRMVVRAMETLVRPGDRCLDLGSGSGILSIAALRLGAASALGVDIDPKAEDMARGNALYNGYAAPTFTALTGNVLQDKALMTRLGQYDLVFANIVADVLVSLSPAIPGFLKPGGTAILSGILDDRLEDVLSALKKAGLKARRILEQEQWRCVTAEKE